MKASACSILMRYIIRGHVIINGFQLKFYVELVTKLALLDFNCKRLLNGLILVGRTKWPMCTLSLFCLRTVSMRQSMVTLSMLFTFFTNASVTPLRIWLAYCCVYYMESHFNIRSYFLISGIEFLISQIEFLNIRN